MNGRQIQLHQDRRIRWWPGALLVGVQWLVGFGVAAVFPATRMWAVLASLACGLGVVLWWLFFSRARWVDRLGAVAVMAVAGFATAELVHESIATGAMGMLLVILAVPVVSLTFVAAVVVGRRMAPAPRRAALLLGILAGYAALTAIRTGGFTGDGEHDLHWRWTPSPEEVLLERAEVDLAQLEAPPSEAITPEDLPLAGPAAPSSPAAVTVAAVASEPAAEEPPARVQVTASEWPGFRGPARDGVVRGLTIDSDWTAAPPREIWRRSVGPGWSSFAVQGGLVYTQEQRGEDEVVAAYRADDGEPVWGHGDATRFWESNAGAGPRATPTLAGGRVYSVGGTGIVNALDAATGRVEWSRSLSEDTGKEVPGWGFSSSPLLVDDLVIAAAAGALVAYDRDTGEPRWRGPEEGWGYSSPHLLSIDGVRQVVLLNGAGAIGLEPASGGVLWEHAWPGDGIVQPAMTADGDLLIGTGSGMGSGAGVGVRRLDVSRDGESWRVEERWTSAGLKPYFNDFVVHEGHAFGFDGGILSCIRLEDGERQWKGGRYGHGQLVLLADQDLLLVLSEKGELALVAAGHDRFQELGRIPAIQGKTWNHPVVAGDLLLVRNGVEMVAYRLATN